MKLLKIILAFISSSFIYLLGGIDVALECLLIAIVIDYFTGFFKAYKLKKLSSSTGLLGILKKIGILMLVALSVIIDKMVGEAGVVRTLIIYYLVANEGLSIIENLSEIGVLVPDFIKEKLEQLKEKGE